MGGPSKRVQHLSIAVNVSPREFRQPKFVDHVLAALDRTGANPQNLKIELSETMFGENVEDVIARMNKLKALRGAISHWRTSAPATRR